MLVALLAGFIGQFGGSLVSRIIKRRRKRTACKETHPCVDVAIEKERSKKADGEKRKSGKQELRNQEKRSG
ncbi:MAG TPA: hypothetical protein ENH11_06225 [Candidatus Acetothermia bacterium]|nr:hypothetical protein [Candidatus Acetothermia bacterium]